MSTYLRFAVGGAAAVCTAVILTGMHASASVHQRVPSGAHVYFEKNEGQHRSGYFRAIGRGFAVSFEDRRAEIFVRGGNSTAIEFLGARAARPVGEVPAAIKVDYMRGKTKSDWHLNVPTFRQVRYRGLYRGIDAVFYGNGKTLEYDFIVDHD